MPARIMLQMQRRMPYAPGYPVLSKLEVPYHDDLTRVAARYSILEEPYILKPRTAAPDWPYTPVKLPGVTAIPEGDYRLIITHSTRLNKPTPRLVDVRDFTGILIHILNVQEETQGCIGIGMHDDGKRVLLQSKIAFDDFMERLERLTLAAPTYLSVKNPVHGMVAHV